MSFALCRPLLSTGYFLQCVGLQVSQPSDESAVDDCAVEVSTLEGIRDKECERRWVIGSTSKLCCLWSTKGASCSPFEMSQRVRLEMMMTSAVSWPGAENKPRVASHVGAQLVYKDARPPG